MNINGIRWLMGRLAGAARLGFLAAALSGCGTSSQAAEAAKTSGAGDDLFTNHLVARLRIEIPPEGVEILQSYQWNRNVNGHDRSNVLATVREGNKVYTNVAIHLKGGLGSFRPFDDKPALTLSFDRSAEGQRFHGLQKIHLNNSAQDPSFLSEKICREMFLAAGLPSPRAGHALGRINDRDLGLYVLVEGWNKQFLKRHFKDARGILSDSGSANE